MGDGQQEEFAALGPVGSAAEGAAKIPFDHTEHDLDLPTLAIRFPVELLSHLPAIFSFRQRHRRPTGPGGMIVSIPQASRANS